MNETKITIFPTVREQDTLHTVKLETVLEKIKTGGDLKSKLIKIKSLSDEARAEEKLNLPAICFGGVFRNRSKDGLVKASGLMVLDFDHVVTDQVKEELSSKPYVVACFNSPSGDGVKAIVRIPEVKDDSEYKMYYYGMMSEFPKLDKSGKDISRACFFCYDPDIYINYEASAFTRFRRQQPTKEEEGINPLDIAVHMVQYAADGEKHSELLKAANLCGGYIATGVLDEDQCSKALFEAVADRADNQELAKKTIRDGIENGKLRPLSAAIKIAREAKFARRADGTFDFLANEKEMNNYIHLFREGKIELGLPTFMGRLDEYWRFKKNTFTIFAGLDNVGKSWQMWYLYVVGAVYHGFKNVIYSAENRDGSLKKKILEFYLNKPIDTMNSSELAKANDFYREHFRIVSSQKSIYKFKDILDFSTELHIGDFPKFDRLLIDPYNSLKKPHSNAYQYDYDMLAEARMFAQQYASVDITAHVHSNSARNKDVDGYIKVPVKADIEGGQPFANRADDFIMYHRLVNHPEMYRTGQLHVQKVKEVETGGKPTPKDDPVMITANADLCGFHVVQNGKKIDVIKDYWDSVLGREKDPIEDFAYGAFDGDAPF